MPAQSRPVQVPTHSGSPSIRFRRPTSRPSASNSRYRDVSRVHTAKVASAPLSRALASSRPDRSCSIRQRCAIETARPHRPPEKTTPPSSIRRPYPAVPLRAKPQSASQSCCWHADTPQSSQRGDAYSRSPRARRTLQPPQRQLQHRLPAHFHQRLGPVVRQRPQPSPQPRRQHHRPHTACVSAACLLVPRPLVRLPQVLYPFQFLMPQLHLNAALARQVLRQLLRQIHRPVLPARAPKRHHQVLESRAADTPPRSRPPAQTHSPRTGSRSPRPAGTRSPPHPCPSIA